MNIRILLVDDHALVRDGFRALLDAQPDFQVVGEAENGRQAVELADRLCPDVVLMDVGMADLNGVDATHQITARDPKVKVVALSAYPQKQFVVSMLEAGAAGYVIKNSSREELMGAIRAVVQNKKYVSSAVAATVVDGMVGRLFSQAPEPGSELSSREREVLQLLAEGRTSREIGARLHISENTVEAHRRSISKKSGLHSVAELTKLAIRTGLTAP